jgi:hypothetical protein
VFGENSAITFPDIKPSELASRIKKFKIDRRSFAANETID